MTLTQKEAKLWGKILTGFSQGKEYVYPLVYDKDMNVIEWMPVTDFVINKGEPTIIMSGHKSFNMLDPELIKEKGK